MEFEYSPVRHHSTLDQLAGLSPTHAHVGLDTYSSLRQLRRTLSRSPSRPARLFSINRNHDTSTPIRVRSIPLRSSTRKISPNSPLRSALTDNINHASPAPRQSRPAFASNDQENAEDMARTTVNKFDEPIKFDLARASLQPVFGGYAPPKSSPLKRSDGKMHLHEQISPKAKRRSLHGTSSLGPEFSVFEQTYDGASEDLMDASSTAPYHFAASHSPRRGVSLRKSTLQQRATPVRMRQHVDAERHLGPALTRARSRISLDGADLPRGLEMDTGVRRRSVYDPPVTFTAPGFQRPFQSAPKPHPLSNALSPSSSTSSMGNDSALPQPAGTQSHAQLPSIFSKSLPLGAQRLQEPDSEDYTTPASYKMAKPLPQAFMSTGLISKRHRNVDLAGSVNGPMPDTPIKKAAQHLLPDAPAYPSFGKLPFHLTELADPNTPFNARDSDVSPELYRTSNIFGTRAADLTRRGSFLGSYDPDNSHSPTHLPESQSSLDDLPPTPTKCANSGPRPQSKGKSNSLRSSLFGRRSSLGPDTFTAPVESTSPSRPGIGIEAPSTQETSPHTPSDHFTPPDASKLSISAEQRASHLFPSNSYPPATPTGPRDQPLNISLGQSLASSGYFANDVDTALTSRFNNVSTVGTGEFSQVYRVQGAYAAGGQPHTVWAVKKSRKPYNGHKDRQRKLQEVHILQQLRGHEHVIEYVDSWEAKGHLYIQTQFCENGNLKDFLTQTGFKGRLDDFRIYKILLEMGLGIKSIHDAGFVHLDIKPANVFIDWEGALKIGDFGLASTWPAPRDVDGEGDREYIAPEILLGRFDKPADVFSLGMIMLEIAGNIVLPDNGKSWQRLRAGDLTDLPSLTWSSDVSLVRSNSGNAVDALFDGDSHDTICMSHAGGDDDLSFLSGSVTVPTRGPDLVVPPNFMVNAHDPQALDKLVQWMIHPNPDQRPIVDELLAAGGVRWVEGRRRAGASVYEGDWGPADEVLVDAGEQGDVEMAEF